MLLPSRGPAVHGHHRHSLREEEGQALQHRLVRAMLDFTASQLGTAGEGALLQIWTPIQTVDGTVVLTAQGSPFSVCGVGDLLALYRMLSTGYRFSTDIHQPEKMGAIGRVYHSTEPEMTGDVQKYTQDVFLRVREAQRCQVRSLMAMPVFDVRYPGKPLAVFELANSKRDTHFPEVMAALMRSLKNVNLGTTDLEMRALNACLRQLPSRCAVGADLPSSRLSVDHKSASMEPLSTLEESHEATQEGADRARACKRTLSAKGDSRMRPRTVVPSPFAAPSECSQPKLDCLEGSAHVTPTSSSNSSFYNTKSKGGSKHGGHAYEDPAACIHVPMADCSTEPASIQQATSPHRLRTNSSQPEPLPSSAHSPLQAPASSPVLPTAHAAALPRSSSSSRLTREAQAMRLLAWLNPPRRKPHREMAQPGSL